MVPSSSQENQDLAMFRLLTSLHGRGANNLGSLTTKGLLIIILKLYFKALHEQIFFWKSYN
jgi:hypothetical protein